MGGFCFVVRRKSHHRRKTFNENSRFTHIFSGQMRGKNSHDLNDDGQQSRRRTSFHLVMLYCPLTLPNDARSAQSSYGQKYSVASAARAMHQLFSMVDRHTLRTGTTIASFNPARDILCFHHEFFHCICNASLAAQIQLEAVTLHSEIKVIAGATRE